MNNKFLRYDDLRNKKGKELTYSESLDSSEWQELRNEIIVRDNHICQKCKRKVSIR